MSDVPLAQHALLSDCGSAALITADGSVDWLCLPASTAPPCSPGCSMTAPGTSGSHRPHRRALRHGGTVAPAWCWTPLGRVQAASSSSPTRWPLVPASADTDLGFMSLASCCGTSDAFTARSLSRWTSSPDPNSVWSTHD